MENKKIVSKKPVPAAAASATASKGVLSNKENSGRQLEKVTMRDVSFKKPALPVRLVSISSDDSNRSMIDTKNKVPISPRIDLNEWESEVKQMMRQWSEINGIDITKFYLLKSYLVMDKKMATKNQVGQTNRNSLFKLLPAFKALDTLLTEKFPPAKVIDLLKPLADVYVVKKSADYWNLYARALAVSGDYKGAVELLDHALEMDPEPIRVMQRAYQSLTHYMLDLLISKETNGTIQAVAVNNGHQNGSNGAIGVETPDHEGGGEIGNSNEENGGGENNGVNGIGNGDNGNEANGGVDEENSETEDGAEGIIFELEEPTNNVLTEEQQLAADIEGGINHELILQVIEEANANDLNQYPASPILIEEPNMNHPNIPLSPTEPGLLDPRLPGTETNQPLAAAASVIPKANGEKRTSKSPGRRSEPLDQSAIFQSSTTKLLVSAKKPTKKQNGASASSAPDFRVTPVRRSTRHAQEHEKWFKYRDTTTVDTPADLSRMGITEGNASFKKNPFLPLPDDEDDSD